MADTIQEALRPNKDAYRVAIMAGTGVTHSVVVDADTGRVRKDVPEPGRPMPNEPFR